GHQEIELTVRQADDGAGRRLQPAAATIQRPTTKPQDRRLLQTVLQRQIRCPAQNRLDAREKLVRIERLGQVVVGANFKADDAVGIRAEQSEQNDRYAARGAQLAAQREAVLARQDAVQHDQIDARTLQNALHIIAVGRDFDAISV